MSKLKEVPIGKCKVGRIYYDVEDKFEAEKFKCVSNDGNIVRFKPLDEQTQFLKDSDGLVPFKVAVSFNFFETVSK